MDFGLTGKTAIVCAGSRGLGRACAEALAAEGARIVLNGRSVDSLQTTADAIADKYGVEVLLAPGDISSDAGRDAVVRIAGDVDILINNGGGPKPGTLEGFSDSDWDSALATNLRAPAEMIRMTLSGMERRGFGRIINITSSVVKFPIDAQGLSAAARAGLHGLTATLVRRAAKSGVTINNVLPGPFATDRLISNFSHKASQEGVSTNEALARRKQQLPSGRFGDPDELGALVAFLCSDKAGYVSGQSIVIDGGAHTAIL